jgi:hypothetical protein
MKEFTVHAKYDADAGVWWASNEQLPLTTEAPSFDLLMTRVMEIAPEIIELNGLAKSGEKFKIHFTTDLVATAAD